MRFNGWTALSLILLLAGLAFWAYMGSTYHNWTDVGVYSVGVTLVGFGVIGAIVSLLRTQPAA
jgi:multidrug resistance efflux pump